MAEESGTILPWRYLQVWLLVVVVSKVNKKTGDKMKLLNKLDIAFVWVGSVDRRKNLHAGLEVLG